jgi:hypothetical protein
VHSRELQFANGVRVSAMTDTAPKPFVFVLMPFEGSFNDVYQLGIKPAAEGAGAYCERIDEQIFAESILARIYNQIAKADLIVADMTGRNPNVFYEVGYAHALGQTVILLTRNSEDIPFDLKHYPHIVYQGSIAGLKEKLQERIAYHLANASETNQIPELPLPHFTISGNLIEPGACIEVPVPTEHYSKEISISVGITNPEDRVLHWSGLNVGLILPSEFSPLYAHGAVQLTDKRYLYEVGYPGEILPGAWKTERIELPYHAIQDSQKRAQLVNAELTIFTRNGPHSTTFFLKFVAGVT